MPSSPLVIVEDLRHLMRFDTEPQILAALGAGLGDDTLKVDAEASCERVRGSIARVLDEAVPGDEVLIAFAEHGTPGRWIVLHNSEREALEMGRESCPHSST